MNPFVISLAVRLTILLLAGGLMAFAVHRSTSAMRHLVIAATLACVIALPITMVLVPEWRVGVFTAKIPVDASTVAATAMIAATPRASASTMIASADAPTRTKISASSSASTRSTASMSRATIHPVLVSGILEPTTYASSSASPTDASANLAASTSPARPPLTPPQIALGIWLLGVVFGLAWIAIGRLGLARVRRRATPLTTYEWRTILEAEAMHAGVARHVALFTSPAVSMPVTWGVLSPVIMLPESALAWSHDRKRVVIMHEMAHIARRDSATQFLATIACVAYWLHPLVILAARRLRAECERACDERVLARGTPAAEYAAHLLDVARLSRSFGAASIVSVAMARPSQLEGRLLAVLRGTPRQTRMSTRARVATTLGAAATLVAISAFKPVVREVTAPEAKTHDAKLVRQTTSGTRAATSSDTGEARATKPRAPLPPSAPRADAPSEPPSIEAAIATEATPALAAPVAPVAPAAPAIASAPPAVRALRATPDFGWISPPASAPSAFLAPVAPSQGAPSVPRAPSFPAPSFPAPSAFGNSRDSTFEKSVPAHAGGTLDIDLDTGGDIEIIGSDDATVSVKATLSGHDVSGQTVTLEGSSGDAELKSRFEHASGTENSSDVFTIRVPKKYDVHVSSAGGTITIKDLDGAFRGSTGGGNISIANAHGSANLSTGGGKVQISNSHLDGSVMTGFGPVMFHDVTGSIVDSYSARRTSESMKIEMPERERRKTWVGGDDDSDPQWSARVERDRARVMRDTAWSRDFANLDKMRVMIDDTAMVKVRKAMKRAQIAIRMDTAYMESLRDLDNLNEDYGDSARKYSKRRKVYIRSGDSTQLLSLEPYRLQLDASRLALDAQKRVYVAMRESEKVRPFARDFDIVTDEDDAKGHTDRVIVIDKSGGSVQLREAPHGAHIVTGGGAISIGPSSGAVSAITGGGDIEIGPARGTAHAATGAGDVAITMADGDAHPMTIESGKGDVEVTLPKNANVTLDLETAYTEKFGRHTKIEGDWPVTVTESSDWDSSHGTPRKYVRVRQQLGKGGPVIRVRTVNGDIRLKRMD